MKSIYRLKLVLSFSSDKYPEMGLLDHTIVLFFIFLRNFHSVFHMAIPIYIPTNSAYGFLLLNILTNSCYFLTFLITAILTG